MKRAAAVLGIALAGSQAGHLLAYELRYGQAAQAVQSSGAHAYFPLLLKTVAGGAALAAIASLLIVALARVAAGGRVEVHSAPSLLRLASIIYTLQLACFVVQELLEGGSASQVVLWGLVGQLPVALAATLALRWLLARVAPALSSLSIRAEPALQLLVFAFAPVLRPMPVAARSSRRPFVGPLTRRGPPPSF